MGGGCGDCVFPCSKAFVRLFTENNNGGKEVLSLFNDNAFMTSTTEKPSNSSTDEIEMLENLYRMKVQKKNFKHRKIKS